MTSSLGGSLSLIASLVLRRQIALSAERKLSIPVLPSVWAKRTYLWKPVLVCKGFCLFVCNHIAFGRWRPWRIPYISPPRFFRNIKKQKQSRKSSSPLTKETAKNNIKLFTPPHHSTPCDLSSPPPPPLC